MLLELEEVNPDKPNIDGDTQLLNATWLEQGGVVKILLGLEEVCPDRPGHYGLTPLTYAAWVGRDDDNSDMPGCDGQCSQSSGAPVGPGGGTAKTPGPDGTTKCRPSSSLNFQDGRH